jgi:hypothetical protein
MCVCVQAVERIDQHWAASRGEISSRGAHEASHVRTKYKREYYTLPTGTLRAIRVLPCYVMLYLCVRCPCMHAYMHTCIQDRHVPRTWYRASIQTQSAMSLPLQRQPNTQTRPDQTRSSSIYHGPHHAACPGSRDVEIPRSCPRHAHRDTHTARCSRPLVCKGPSAWITHAWLRGGEAV